MSVGLPLFEQLDRQTAQRRLILARARGLSLTPMHRAVRQCVSLGRSCLGATSRVPVGVCLRRPPAGRAVQNGLRRFGVFPRGNDAALRSRAAASGARQAAGAVLRVLPESSLQPSDRPCEFRTIFTLT